MLSSSVALDSAMTCAFCSNGALQQSASAFCSCWRPVSHALRRSVCSSSRPTSCIVHVDNALPVLFGCCEPVQRLGDPARFELTCIVCRSVVNLDKLAKERMFRTTSLSNLCSLILAFRLSKKAQCSNWQRRQLTDQQVMYAATDAWASRELGLQLIQEGAL